MQHIFILFCRRNLEGVKSNVFFLTSFESRVLIWQPFIIIDSIILKSDLAFCCPLNDFIQIYDMSIMDINHDFSTNTVFFLAAHRKFPSKVVFTISGLPFQKKSGWFPRIDHQGERHRIPRICCIKNPYRLQVCTFFIWPWLKKPIS